MQSMMTLDAFGPAMKPMTHLLELQRSMLESLAEQQTQLSTELMTDALEEARALCNCGSVPELMEVHKNFLQVSGENGGACHEPGVVMDSSQRRSTECDENEC